MSRDRRPGSFAGWLGCCFLLSLIAGCDGCRRESDEEREAKKEAAKQPPFTFRAAKAFPTSRMESGTQGAPDGAVKPGHWVTIGLDLKSNRDDRFGSIATRGKVNRSNAKAFFSGETNVAPTNTPILAGRDPNATRESMLVRRPAVLPKGQRRRLDTRMLVPSNSWQAVDSVSFGGVFESKDSAIRADLAPSRFAVLQPQAFFFVILTEQPDRFTRLQTADWAKKYRNPFEFERDVENYRLVIPPTQGLLPISETALDWTSTAVLFWDDLPSVALTSLQRTALNDWLHFGGTLIVNGPAANDAITEPELKALLPLTSDGNEELVVDDAVKLVRSMAVQSDASTASVIATLGDGTARVRLASQPKKSAQPIGEGGLLWQRSVGRGRVVQSRVDLLSPWLLGWSSYESFFNSAILARPPRVFEPDNNLPDYVKDDADNESNLPPLRHRTVGWANDMVPPTFNTRLRWLARDGRFPQPSADSEPDASDSVEESQSASRDRSTTIDPLAPWRDSTAWVHPVSGLGGWNDTSPYVLLARESLRGAIGVQIPDSSLVIRSLALYLFILIPLNYLVFRLIGRLEWAWLAVVPLALLGVFFVARAAQLDVGLARSRNEIALLELPVGYHRGHLSRVIGLYNSLSSEYDVAFADQDAAAAEIKMQGSQAEETNLFGDAEAWLQIGYELGPELTGVRVGSNAFGTVHTEQMVDVGGEIRWDAEKMRLDNQSSLDLENVVIVDKRSKSDVQVAQFPILVSGAAKDVELRPWSPRSDMTNARAQGEFGAVDLKIEDLVGRLANPAGMLVGERRLIARVPRAIEGLTISPDCSQVQAETVVVAHLASPRFPSPIPDKNLIGDFRRRQTELKPASSN